MSNDSPEQDEYSVKIEAGYVRVKADSKEEAENKATGVYTSKTCKAEVINSGEAYRE
jgi:hypothetical protein